MFVKQILATQCVFVKYLPFKKRKEKEIFIFEVLYLNFAGVIKKEKLVKVNHVLQISLLKY